MIWSYCVLTISQCIDSYCDWSPIHACLNRSMCWLQNCFQNVNRSFLKVERIRLAQWVDYNDHGQINNVIINWMFIITKRTLEYTKKKIVFWQSRLFRQLLTSMLESIRKIWLCFVEEHCFTNAPFNIIGISELVCINEDINSTFEL